MWRYKDIILKKVIDKDGKNMGEVKDILINFSKAKVTGFKVSSPSLMAKDINISIKDIIYINERIIAGGKCKDRFLEFNSIRHLEVIDKDDNIVGFLEDIIIDPEDYTIKAMVICEGFLYKLFSQKKIVSLRNLILGEDNIIICEREGIEFMNLPNKRLW
ncbi:PRC-barrel domain-containing protein [Clostridium algidicarnis]|uniref:PRC-barrel domain-containing protein n=1 Tax=Clostridium algidicarnis TaxID=37659 RepID=UPI001C0D6874|nr:PRC-barrel domain-containing protein [Clostridium algidicarnis]MBU3195713.1 PRC-barrel domain-containing protein [Clostridium algidicarnis]MBU3208735.1 PRC-barrel domain-containing protein [Clostridium algidicarnis]MBU3226754.1 PRC-barrel domain-containing protein [Clostridium algidicarnis]MBU3250335.1 PRC-barrel domain-containing protein [Clostridium algidicarnis]